MLQIESSYRYKLHDLNTSLQIEPKSKFIFSLLLIQIEILNRASLCSKKPARF